MIAQELLKLIEPSIKQAVNSIAAEQMDEWLDSNQAAELLGWSRGTLYNRILEVPHTKFGNKLRFKKSTLLNLINR